MFTNFSKWVITYIAKITLILCCSSLVSLVLYFITSNRLVNLLDVLPVYFGFLGTNWALLYLEMPSGTYVALDILRLFLIVTMIIGAIIYMQSKGKERKLLYFSYAIIFIGSIFNLADFLFKRIFREEFDEIFSFITRDQYSYNWALEIYTVLTWLLLIIISYSVLKHFNSNTRLITNKESSTDVYNKSSNWKRLFHFIFDLIIFLSIATEFMQNILILVSHKLGSSGQFKDIAIPILIFIFTVLYYTIFEYLFSTTPSKILSHSKIISTNKNNLTLSKALGRSLSRHIPLNQISFLFNNGWHDVLTETTVVDIEEQTTYLAIYWVLFIILVVGLIANYLIYPFS
ncbi:RDD family protein [uncultured Winogradskyella sp.]|uniref:RDD family protein n=1 Tax=uncultured Winogradskyella sp. TaxID=395353 RepID=UPI0026378861|nr:RDD family protein [uncultured Winogradskyella sp.]